MRLTSYYQTSLALGSDVGLTLISNKSANDIDKIFKSLWNRIYTFERSFSRFIPGSELSLFNRSAGQHTKISTEFRDLLNAAKSISEQTGGLYNPFIMPALQKTGYKQSAVEGYEHDIVDDYSRRRVGKIDELQIGDDWAMIPSDTAIDMGGCGKGYLADSLGDTLVGLGITNFRLSLGGDITTDGTDEFGCKWKIGIQDAGNLGGEIQQTIECPTSRFAVATSGTFKRKGFVADEGWHHIINPATLQPAVTDVRLATICADKALLADVLASCVIIIGSKGATNFAKSHGASAMLLQCLNTNSVFQIQFGHFIINESASEGL